jgi:hypothetical protein
VIVSDMVSAPRKVGTVAGPLLLVWLPGAKVPYLDLTKDAVS